MYDMNNPVITLEDLRMSYGANDVLMGINLEIPKGQIIGYIGPNGAGKSTTIKIILGMVNGYSGRVTVLGQDIADGKVDYKRHIGYVPETSDMYDSLTPYEYLTFLGEVYGLSYDTVNKRAKKLMNIFGIEQEYHSRISSFSKGMRQKVLLIACLIHNPDILFLDEPLSGLDANSVLVVKEVLANLASSGKTIFYSSHIMEVVEKISDRIILLSHGQVIADGTFEELKERSSEGSLEEIFNQLTGFNSHKEIADEFVDVLNEV